MKRCPQCWGVLFYAVWGNKMNQNPSFSMKILKILTVGNVIVIYSKWFFLVVSIVSMFKFILDQAHSDLFSMVVCLSGTSENILALCFSFSAQSSQVLVLHYTFHMQLSKRTNLKLIIGTCGKGKEEKHQVWFSGKNCLELNKNVIKLLDPILQRNRREKVTNSRDIL